MPSVIKTVRLSLPFTALFRKIQGAGFALLLISFLLALYTFMTVSQFKALPAPIFGGDLYYQQGAVEHIMAGGNPLVSSSIPGGVPGYLPVFPALVAAFSILFGLDASAGLMYFSVIVAFLMPIFWALTIRNFVQDEWWAVIGALAVILTGCIENPLIALPIMKYTEFSFALMLPLFLNFLYCTYSDFSVKQTALFALFYSILTLSHMLVFIDASVILLVVFGFSLFLSWREGSAVTTVLRKHWRQGLVFAVIAVPILLSYWYRPIFIYHLQMAYDRVHIDFPDFAIRKVQLDFLSARLRDLFFNFSGIDQTIKSAFFIFAVSAVVFNIKKIFSDRQITFLSAVNIASFLVTFSYFVTEPALDINFIPPYMFWITVPPALTVLGIHFLDRRIPNKNTVKRKLAYLSIVVILLLFGFARFKTERETNRFFQNYTSPVPNCLLSLADYVKKNTSVNDVFLTSKELGFMINSLTGRKLLTNRWLHQNDPYIDLPQRDMHAAIILYGNNMNTRLDLIHRYNVKYLYWDINWIMMEYRISQDRRLVKLDPLHPLDSREARETLDKNGVRYQIITTWLDPAVAFPDYRQFKALLISPENYNSNDMPWGPQLNSYLEEVWSFHESGKKIAALYKIRAVSTPEI